MRPYLANPKLTAPDYDWADMSPGALRAATQPDGRIDSLPVETDVWLVYYNKQLFGDRGLTLPEDVRRDAGHGPQDQPTRPRASTASSPAA